MIPENSNGGTGKINAEFRDEALKQLLERDLFMLKRKEPVVIYPPKKDTAIFLKHRKDKQ